jgi:hypothetical protein
MQTHQQQRVLDAPDGLFPLLHNFKIQDMFVGIIGIHTQLSTGVIQTGMVLMVLL